MNHLCLSDFEQIKIMHEKLFKDVNKTFLLYLKSFYHVDYSDIKQIDEMLLEHFRIYYSAPELAIFDVRQNRTILTIKTKREGIITSDDRFRRYIPHQTIDITDWFPLINIHS